MNYKGWKGYFRIGGGDLSGPAAFGQTINSWSIDESVGEVDTSSFDADKDTRSRTYEPGLKEATASISGFADLTNTGQGLIKYSLDEGQKYYGYFHLDGTSKYYLGELFVTSRTIDHSFDDNVAEVSVDFRLTGEITESN